MKIGIGVPNAVPGTSGPGLVEWARRAEAAGFSTLGTLGRLAYDCHEELMVLAAAASVTERIRLATTVLISPVREPVLLAKQTQTLNAISKGRLTLGIAVGYREEEYRATRTSFERRGSIQSHQIDVLRKVWSGREVGNVGDEEDFGRVGPLPAGESAPELVLGGNARGAMERAGRQADGYISMPVPPAAVQPSKEVVAAAWNKAGREGQPRFLTPAYFALGDLGSAPDDNLASYYSRLGEDAIKFMQSQMLRTADAIRDRAEGLEDIGIDEFILWPTVANLDQVDRVAEALAHLPQFELFSRKIEGAG